MKKVGCLYRVSSKKQVDKNDIPLQKIACRDFIRNKNDWILEKEYFELGISGYKIKSENRDQLVEIKKDVLNKKIDVLLVFMFDRIGRQEAESPMVVRWLIQQGIEVWSVNEGQRKIENSVDKLINYLTFWQAEGESEKISIRATEKRIQLIKDGFYLGYYAPYGYEMVESEELKTKLGKKRRILKIFPKEANIVKKIFELITQEMFGFEKIAKFLNKKNILTRTGKKWTEKTISDIVRNPIYKGYVSFGKRTKRKDLPNTRNSKSDWILAEKPNKDIIIVSEEIWNKANDIVDNRKPNPGKRKLRLLSEMLSCGYCKKSIIPHGKGKYTYMYCKNKIVTGDCNYQAFYRVDHLEKTITEIIYEYLDRIEKIDLTEEINKKLHNEKKEYSKLKEIQNKVNQLNENISLLKEKVIETLLTDNKEEQLKVNKEFEKNNKELKILLSEKNKLEKSINNNKVINKDIKTFIPVWKKEFKEASLERKREILKILVQRIYLYNDKIEVIVKYPIKELIVDEVKKR